METEEIRERDGSRRFAWVVVWTIVGLLALLSLAALGHVVRAVGSRLLSATGMFDPVAVFVQSGAILLVVAGALILPIVVITRVVRARSSSPGDARTREKVFTPSILVAAALLVLFASAIYQPFGPLDTGALVNFPPSLFYLGLIFVAIGAALFATDERFRTSPALADTAQTPSSMEPRAGRPRRERSHLGTFTLGGLFIVVALLGLAGSFGVANVDVRIVPALVLTVLGAGLFLGSWVGRARWLTILCLLTLPFVALANIVDVPVSGGIGNVTFVASSAGALQTSYHYGIGHMTLDLSNLKPTAAERTIHATLAGGELVVEIPRGLHVVVDASVRTGQITLTHRSSIYRSGVDVHAGSTFGADSPGLIHVIAHCAVGTVRVYYVGKAAPKATQPDGASKPGSPQGKA